MPQKYRGSTVPNETDEITDEVEETVPLEVKIVQDKKETKWNDSVEDTEYDEHIITDEEIKEHGNT